MKIRRYRKKRELREDFSKPKSETKDTIKKEVYESKIATQNIKKELNKSMETLRKKNQTEILELKSPFSQTKNILDVHYSR
jgi:hypothetical protein